MFSCTGTGKTAIKAQLTAHQRNWIITYPSPKGLSTPKGAWHTAGRSCSGLCWQPGSGQAQEAGAELPQTPRTCVRPAPDPKVPAWGNVHGLGVDVALSVPVAALGLCPAVPTGWGGVELLQVHVVVDQDHLAHPRVIAGHVRLPDVGQDDGGVVQESHPVTGSSSRYYLLSILLHGHTYLEITHPALRNKHKQPKPQPHGSLLGMHKPRLT